MEEGFHAMGSLSTFKEDCLTPYPVPDVEGLDTSFWKFSDLTAKVVFLLDHLGTTETTWEATISSDGSVSWENKNLSRYRPEYQAYWSIPPFSNIITAEWTPNGLILKIDYPADMATGYYRFWYCGLSIKGSIEYLHNNMEADEDENAPRWYEGPRVESEKCQTIVADHLQQPADAERLAKALYGTLRGATASWKSLTDCPAGAIVRVHHPTRGIDLVARIKRRSLSVGTTVATWSYEAEGVSPFSINSTYYPFMLPARSTARPSSSAGLAAALEALAGLNNKVPVSELESFASSFIQLHASTQIFTVNGADTLDPTLQRIKLGLPEKELMPLLIRHLMTKKYNHPAP
jgi:hypothetical protein